MGSNYAHLSTQQRREIQRGLRTGLSMAKIAATLGVDRSTVHREVKRVAEQIGGRYTAARGERAYELGRKQNGLARRKA
jgi:IS30 family transposase